MSHKNGGGMFVQLLKTLVVSLLKIVGLTIAFICKLGSMVLHKISELLEKFVGHGSGH